MKKIFISLVMIGVGFLYHYMITIEVHSSSSTVTLSSKISQTVTLHMKRLRETATLVCNDQMIHFIEPKKYDYFYHGEEEVKLVLKRGENYCKMQYIDTLIKVKLSLLNFIVLFILWGLPLFHAVFRVFIYLLEILRKR